MASKTVLDEITRKINSKRGTSFGKLKPKGKTSKSKEKTLSLRKHVNALSGISESKSRSPPLNYLHNMLKRNKKIKKELSARILNKDSMSSLLKSNRGSFYEKQRKRSKEKTVSLRRIVEDMRKGAPESSLLTGQITLRERLKRFENKNDEIKDRILDLKVKRVWVDDSFSRKHSELAQGTIDREIGQAKRNFRGPVSFFRKVTNGRLGVDPKILNDLIGLTFDSLAQFSEMVQSKSVSPNELKRKVLCVIHKLCSPNINRGDKIVQSIVPGDQDNVFKADTYGDLRRRSGADFAYYEKLERDLLRPSKSISRERKTNSRKRANSNTRSNWKTELSGKRRSIMKSLSRSKSKSKKRVTIQEIRNKDKATPLIRAELKTFRQRSLETLRNQKKNKKLREGLSPVSGRPFKSTKTFPKHLLTHKSEAREKIKRLLRTQRNKSISFLGQKKEKQRKLAMKDFKESRVSLRSLKIPELPEKGRSSGSFRGSLGSRLIPNKLDLKQEDKQRKLHRDLKRITRESNNPNFQEFLGKLNAEKKNGKIKITSGLKVFAEGNQILVGFW